MIVTKSMRESIEEKETVKKFKEKIEAAEKELLVEIEKEVIKLIPKIPQELIDAGYIKLENDVEVEYSDNRRENENYELSNYYPAPVNSYRFKIKANAKIKTLKVKLGALEDAERKFRQDLRRCLLAFNTHKPLVTAMPELAVYFKDETRAQSMAIVPFEQINEVRKQLVRP